MEKKLFIEHIKALKSGISIEMPIYSFVTHLREKGTIQVVPKKVILVERLS